MAPIISAQNAILHRQVYELRYHHGYTFIDRAGQILNYLLYDTGDEWIDGERSGDRFSVSKGSTNTTFSYGNEKLDLNEVQSEKVATLRPIEKFGKDADDLSRAVINFLLLNSFSRIGFRTWYLLKVDNKADGVKAIQESSIYSIGNDICGLGDVDDTSFSIVLNRGQYKVRLALAVAEQVIQLAPSVYDAAKKEPHKERSHQRKILQEKMRAQKAIANYPLYGVLVDMDFFIEDPLVPDDLKIVDFITSREKDSKDLLKMMFP